VPWKKNKVHAEHSGSRNPENSQTLEATFSLNCTELTALMGTCV